MIINKSPPEESVILITGGTYGLGLDMVLDLAERGYKVSTFGLIDPQPSSTAQGLDQLRYKLTERGLEDKVLYMEGDVTDECSVRNVVGKTLSRFGRIDGLVNNAAIGPTGTVLEMNEELFMKVQEVNVKGPYLVSRAVIPYFKEQGGGAIVNIGSGAAYGKANMAAYAASKGALLSLSKAMALDHFHDRIRVNVVIPGGGGIVTGMSVGRFGSEELFQKQAYSGTVAGRPMSGYDLSGAVAYLLSSESLAISGTVIDVGCFGLQGGSIPIR